MHDKFVLFRNDFTGENLFFTDAEQILTAWTIDDVAPVFTALEKAREQGKWSAGFLSYEAGHVLEPALARRIKPRDTDQRACPLMCFGIYSAPQAPDASLEILQQTNLDAGLAQWSPRWNFDEYRQRFDQLHRHLHAGDCFQANLTFDITAHCASTAAELFNSLRARQAVAHSALVALDGPQIVSRSPELFFRVAHDGWIESKPMKGTAPRGKTKEQDQHLKQQLEEDPKCRSENLMIVDLLRNDLSRVCTAGSVHVPRLYGVESFATVHQMVSTVRGRLDRTNGIADVMRAIFPCGSITGAPKIRAMEIIRELEDTDRNAYCGSIGWIAPGGTMEFNVAIRTISLYGDGHAVFNVGGGIIFDSDVQAEYEECLIKARFALAATAQNTD